MSPGLLDHYNLHKESKCTLLHEEKEKGLSHPYICMSHFPKYTGNDNIIELYFTTNSDDRSRDFLTLFKNYSKAKRKKILKREVKSLLSELGLNKKHSDKIKTSKYGYNIGLIDKIINHYESLQSKKIKNQIVLYIEFLYGGGMNYQVIRNLKGRIKIKKL